jgi:NADPH:quinone reductase
VTATVRSAHRRSQVEKLGARVIDLAETEAHGPFDVVLELVGAPNLGANLRSLAIKGRISVIGTGAGATGEIDLGLLMARRGRLFGSHLRSRALEEKAIAARLVEAHVLPLFDSRSLTVPVDSVFALSDAPSAYAHFAAPGKFGKVILQP